MTDKIEQFKDEIEKIVALIYSNLQAKAELVLDSDREEMEYGIKSNGTNIVDISFDDMLETFVKSLKEPAGFNEKCVIILRVIPFNKNIDLEKSIIVDIHNNRSSIESYARSVLKNNNIFLKVISRT